MRIVFCFFFICIVLLTLTQCENKIAPAIHLNVEKEPLEKLSEYHFFINDIKNMEPNNGLISYHLLNPLFYCNTLSNHFYYIPKGETIAYNEKDVLNFPIGSCLIRNVFYYKDEKDSIHSKKLIETQLLIHSSNAWKAYNYLWNDQQTEAFLNKEARETYLESKDIHGNTFVSIYPVYHYNQCKNCHSNTEKLSPIGIKVANLNHPIVYKDTMKRNQLDLWASLGYLKGLKCPATSPQLPLWNDVSVDIEQRALAYLDVQCAHCHSNENSLDLRYNDEDTAHVSLYTKHDQLSELVENKDYFIIPKNPDKSSIYEVLSSLKHHRIAYGTDAPVIHLAGKQLIYDWIIQMNSKKKNIDEKQKCKLN